MDFRKLALISVILVFLSSLGLSASVGTIPGFIEIGEVERGETVQQEVYVSTNFQQSFSVEPTVTEGSYSYLTGDSDNRFQTSEQDLNSWVSVENIEVDPSTSVGPEDVDADGSFTLTLNVPGDAEPGYHYGKIELNPQLGNSANSPGTVNWGETVPYFSFRVPGNAERDLQVQNVRAFRLDGNLAAVEALIANTGTVTASTAGMNLDIYNSNRNQVTTVDFADVTLPPDGPDSSQWVEAYWKEPGGIQEGAYQVNGSLDYFTGRATASSSFSLPGFDVVEVRPGDDDSSSQSDGGIPIWLVFMILIVLAVLMWSFDVEPFWILLIVGFLGISAFILVSGLPNLLLIILLMLVGIVLYMEM
jgi:hypothetical protein